jgi:hypothetical protein
MFNPYFCVVYRVSDTYRSSFSTPEAAFAFQRERGGVVYCCDGFGNITVRADRMVEG